MEGVSRLFSKDVYERKVYRYSLIIANYGYMGYALAESLLGPVKLMNVMMFALPLSVYTYTVGFSSLTKRKLSLRKLINPVNISMLLGIAVGLCGISVPTVITEAAGKASSCMAPISMLMAGIVISEFRLSDLLRKPQYYALVELRLAGIPLLLGGTLTLLGNPNIVEAAVVLLAMPCGLNTIVFPKIVGENCEIGAGLAFISNILACITIPLVFWTFGIG
jgi:predicted permease